MGSDIVTIDNPHDEDPFYIINIIEQLIYQYVFIRVDGEKFSVGLVFIVVNSKDTYSLKDETMIIADQLDFNNIIHGVL